MSEPISSVDRAARPHELAALRSLDDICTTRRAMPSQRLPDYELAVATGPRKRLSHFLGGRPRLFVIHNMGMACAYCAAYADGLNGILPHLLSVGAVVLVAPDSPEAFEKFAYSRGWKFEIASVHGTTLSRDTGLEPQQGDYWPGVLIVELGTEGLLLTAKYAFEPGDHFSPLWPMLRLAGISEEQWRPRLKYA